jgi:hypothetical protein
MGNHPDQFEDLKLHKDKDDTEVEEIKGGLAIKGTGRFMLHINDDEGAVHLIKIPSSKNVPELKICLLSPHQWVQEAQDKYPLPRGMRMEEDDEALILLIWKQGKHRQTILYHPLISTPSFRTAPALCTYHAVVALCEAAVAQYYRREHVLQMHGKLQLDEDFMTEKNVHSNTQKKMPSASEGAMNNDVTVQASNLSSEKESETDTQMIKMGSLTLNVNLQLEEDKHVYLSAADDQAELMRWH